MRRAASRSAGNSGRASTRLSPVADEALAGAIERKAEALVGERQPGPVRKAVGLRDHRFSPLRRTPTAGPSAGPTAELTAGRSRSGASGARLADAPVGHPREHLGHVEHPPRPALAAHPPPRC